MSDVQDTMLFARHEELLANETYLKTTLEHHRANAATIVGGPREVLIQHRITCDSLSQRLTDTMHEIEFTERLIAARFTAGKFDLQNLNVEEQ